MMLTRTSRGIPHIGPKKVWDMLGSKGVWEGLITSYDPSSMTMDPQKACDGFVAALYRDKFCKHARGASMKQVLSSLMASNLKDGTKKLLPTEDRAVRLPLPARLLLHP